MVGKPSSFSGCESELLWWAAVNLDTTSIASTNKDTTSIASTTKGNATCVASSTKCNATCSASSTKDTCVVSIVVAWSSSSKNVSTCDTCNTSSCKWSWFNSADSMANCVSWWRWCLGNLQTTNDSCSTLRDLLFTWVVQVQSCWSWWKVCGQTMDLSLECILVVYKVRLKAVKSLSEAIVLSMKALVLSSCLLDLDLPFGSLICKLSLEIAELPVFCSQSSVITFKWVNVGEHGTLICSISVNQGSKFILLDKNCIVLSRECQVILVKSLVLTGHWTQILLELGLQLTSSLGCNGVKLLFSSSV